jgi:hypothetical protein
MKGKLIHDQDGWWVQHSATSPDGKEYFQVDTMLHPDDVKFLEDCRLVFDNIEARVAANPEVEFRTVTEIVAPVGDLDTDDYYTITYAKLINHSVDTNEMVNETVKVKIKKDSEAAKAFESLRQEKKEFKENVQSGKIMPPHIKEKIDKLTGELKKVYELAEQSWEGCDGCDENDKNFWMNGFQKGYYTAKPDHLSDEEIEKAMEKHINNDLDLYESLVDGHISYNTGIDLLNNLFIAGAKWYREQLKNRI